MIEPYLYFNGNCKEAIAFYQDVFGIERVHVRTYGMSRAHPEYPIPHEIEQLVLHAEMKIYDTVFNLSDTLNPFSAGNNVSVTVKLSSKETLQTIFEKLSSGAKIGMRLAPTFFSALYGTLMDKFGIVWELIHTENGALIPYTAGVNDALAQERLNARNFQSSAFNAP